MGGEVGDGIEVGGHTVLSRSYVLRQKKNLMIHVHMGHFAACGHQRDLYVVSQTFTT